MMLNTVTSWCKLNKMTMNTGKTKSMVIESSGHVDQNKPKMYIVIESSGHVDQNKPKMYHGDNFLSQVHTL